MDTVSLQPRSLHSLLGSAAAPLLVDVRRPAAYDADSHAIAGAVRAAGDLVDFVRRHAAGRNVVTYCVHGHEVSQDAAALLASHGYDARSLEGGHEQWRSEGGATLPWREPTHWVTRARPKIDRIACPWLVRRFVDPSAVFHYVPNAEVRAFAAAHGATPYDVPDVVYTHSGARCSFDAFIERHGLDDPALDRLALIVRGADTASLDLAAEAPGLLAVSLGLSTMIADDHAMLRFGMLVYDALYAWCRAQTVAAHGATSDALRVQPAARRASA